MENKARKLMVHELTAHWIVLVISSYIRSNCRSSISFSNIIFHSIIFIRDSSVEAESQFGDLEFWSILRMRLFVCERETSKSDSSSFISFSPFKPTFLDNFLAWEDKWKSSALWACKTSHYTSDCVRLITHIQNYWTGKTCIEYNLSYL